MFKRYAVVGNVIENCQNFIFKSIGVFLTTSFDTADKDKFQIAVFKAT